MIFRNSRKHIPSELRSKIEEYIRGAYAEEAPVSDAVTVREDAMLSLRYDIEPSLDLDAVYKDDALEDLIQSIPFEEKADEYEDSFKEAAKHGGPCKERPVSGSCSGAAPAANHALRPGSHKPSHAAMEEFRKEEAEAFAARKEKEFLFNSLSHHKIQAGCKDSAADDIKRILSAKEPGFGASLAGKIDELGLRDSRVYRAAQVSKAAFNKIINDKSVPKRQTAVPLVLVLGLDPAQSYKLLETAGIVLSSSSHFDLIIRYCFEHSIRDIDIVNDILYEFDQPLLGSAVR